ncbi:hypothetical protein DL89DRAFT_264443 [Linderina pennispora]|uniref:Uncharacterized protein n=1 Tax=Linderina pennispora TaxID=61395 RepID=A0A1Y1WM17_9FUNG|nr:uncharacterized protein DL89DRAFT_264443 [Linderina pennispora]ORX74620.1 hypothetical protein DL89DRAFT_264443 [Linderina pennispora]
MTQTPAEMPNGKHIPAKGKFIALLRRAQTVFLFSDPIFVPDGKPLPDLPEGLQYINIHPSSIEPKPQTLKDYLPKAHAPGSRQDTAAPVTLPTEDVSSMFNSFLPTRDSSTMTLRDRDVPVVQHLKARQEDAGVSADEALAIAHRVLGDNADSVEPPSPAVLRELGLAVPEELMTGPETAQTILAENREMLIRLAEFQEQRADSGDMATISKEEQQVADRLQRNLARVIGAQRPKDVRPPGTEIARAVSELLAYDELYSGTLPPQRRFAFVSNAATYAGYPPAATTVPMERASRKKQAA